MLLTDYIIKPIITEKSVSKKDTRVVAFEVALSSTKQHVSQALALLYKVKVGAVRVVVRKGKEKEKRTKRSACKAAR
ncbi:MAG: 50S ribosomal protein L23 [Microgenomates bacterium OLB22]|nr:MAG: 50S ribosomal protein L23 [Microgenomates bacterium OLB22]